MSTPKDLSEMNFGRLTAKEIVRYDPKKGAIWRCECSCGGEKEVPAAYLLNKKTQSCGCLYNETRQDCVKARKDIADHTSISSLVASKKLMKSNTSGYTGVYFDKRSQRWNAYINFKKKRYHLGSYRDIEDVVKERRLAEERLHDPEIMERFGDLTEERKAEFLAYLQGTPSEIK